LKHQRVLLLIAAIAAARCATAPAPPVVAPVGPLQHLLDPRVGWSGAANEAIDRRFDAAWRSIVAGDFVNARKRLDDVRSRDAAYTPASLAEAAMLLQEGRVEAARAIVDPIAQRDPQYTAAQIYEAEIDVAENRVRSAYDRYRDIIQRPDAPRTASARYAELQTRVFDQLYGAAINAPPEDAIRLLREALLVNPNATAARLLLVQKLIAERRFDEAKREIDPLSSSVAADEPEVQAALAEIDLGNGQYENAIVRYERLVRRDPSSRYSHRLEEVKEQFAAANMPPQVLTAMDAPAITRADLAVLMYWKIASIRFAQNVPPPPIATDIGEIPGRDEVIRAMALGIYPVDPVTRRVNPDAEVNGTALARTAARILTLRGAACARGVPSDQVLAACGISITPDDLPVSGQVATAALEQVDQLTK
jgi:tetratricopeptide (TPR) repeat protein